MRKLLLGLIIGIFFVGCSNTQKKYTQDEIISAVIIDNSYIVNRAIKRGFNINQLLTNGDTLLSLALNENSLHVLATLLANGVDINEELPQHRLLGTNIVVSAKAPVFLIRSSEALDMFIRNNVDLNVFDSDGQLLINYYIKTKPEKLAITLIKSGVDLEIKDRSEWYPIFWAVITENLEILKTILKKDSKQYLLRDKKGNYPIYYADSEVMIKELLKNNYNLNTKNIYGENILGEVYLKAKKLGYDEVVDLLLKMGVDKNYRSYNLNYITN